MMRISGRSDGRRWGCSMRWWSEGQVSDTNRNEVTATHHLISPHQ
jgi:hypothetical protein